MARTAAQRAASRANLAKARAARRARHGSGFAARTSSGHSARRRAKRTKYANSLAVKISAGAEDHNTKWQRKVTKARAKGKATAARKAAAGRVGGWLPPVDSSRRGTASTKTSRATKGKKFPGHLTDAQLHRASGRSGPGRSITPVHDVGW